MAKRPTTRTKPQARAAQASVGRQARSKPARKRKTQTLPPPPAAVAQPHPWLDTAKNVGFIGALLAGLGAAVWGGLQHPGKAPDNSQNVATPVGTPPVPPIVELQPQPPVKFEIPKAEVEKEPVVTPPQVLPAPPALDHGPGRRRHR